MTADSVPRQPICRFTISRTPPFRLSFHLCVSRCTGVFPVGSFVERGSSEWSRVRSAACSVARVCQLTPFRSRTTLCLLSLLHHRGRWVSLTYHGRCVAFGRPKMSVWGHAGARSRTSKVACISFLRALFWHEFDVSVSFFPFWTPSAVCLSAVCHSALRTGPRTRWRPSIAHRTQ